jgi:hypothetical protein
MISSRPFALLLALSLGVSAGLPTPARAENPLEKLHKKLFGDDDRKRDDDKEKDKDKDKARRHDHDDHDDHDHRRYDDRRYDRRETVVVQPRIYVEPAPRTYYQPAPRSYYAPRSIDADVQFALRREGYYRGPIDGDLGPGSRAAIRDYQIDRRLPATGRIDNHLLRSLGL